MSPLADNHTTDRHLVEKVLRGDSHAFAQIIKNTEGLVVQMVFRMVSNTNDHKDIAQDVYLKAFKNLPGFRFQAKLSTWIGQITYNTCLNYLEKKKLVLMHTGEQDDADDEEETIAHLHHSTATGGTHEPVQQLSAKELTGILKTQIDRLSPMYKTLITLYHQEELSYAEIAQITSLPEGTVKSYLFRARKALKEHLLSGYKREEL